ncbi:MAG TPA: hypothetical protein VFI38_06355 [Candidatus Acidoferrum sp.]|nr:hypothetical protein [Candidatus Acidoferrum sp.]
MLKQIASMLAFSSLFLCAPGRSQTLVYSLTYAETRASYHAHFANASPFPGRRTDDENLSMLRGTRKTEIYSLSLATGKSTLLFSDEGPHLEIKVTGALSKDRKAYFAGTWRERRTTPSVMVTSEEGIYEISLDGTNKFRKVADAQPNQPPAVLNRQSTRAAFESIKENKYVVSIYSLPEWKLLRTFDLDKLMKAHCPACTPLSYGWLADGKRLYFEITEVGDDEEATAATNRPGTYLFTEEGEELGSLSPQAGAVPFEGEIKANFAEGHFLGQLADGSDLFEDYAVKKGGPVSELHPYLIVTGGESKEQKVFPLKFGINRAVPSPSGQYLAHLEERRTRDYRAELYLWVKNLATGEDKEVFAAPPPNAPNSPEPNVTLSLLGWFSE